MSSNMHNSRRSRGTHSQVVCALLQIRYQVEPEMVLNYLNSHALCYAATAMYTLSSTFGKITLIQSDTNTKSNGSPLRPCSSLCHESLPFHGAKMYSKANSLQRILWLGAIVLVAIIASLSTYQVLKDYFGYRTATHLIIRKNSSLLLPSLHVCPKNPDHLKYEILFADIDQRVANLTNDIKKDILLYFIAGNAFMNTGIDKWDENYRTAIGQLFASWKGNRTTMEMFDLVFNVNGIQCEDIFESCFPISCCKYFKPHYVMQRGRCLRLDNYYQLAGGESHSLRLDFKQPDGLLIDGNRQRQIVVYFGDKYPEVARFSRIYVTENDYGIVRFRVRKVSMIQKKDCATNPQQRGRSTCYVNRWLQQNIIEPFNCTLPSMRDIQVAKGYNICHPHVIVEHYRNISTEGTLKNKCILNCDRWDLEYQYSTHVDRKQKRFRLELAFRDLSYEEYEEIAMLSTPRFISQIGGQLGLFLGTSVVSLFYVFSRLLKKLVNR